MNEQKLFLLSLFKARGEGSMKSAIKTFVMLSVVCLAATIPTKADVLYTISFGALTLPPEFGGLTYAPDIFSFSTPSIPDLVPGSGIGQTYSVSGASLNGFSITGISIFLQTGGGGQNFVEIASTNFPSVVTPKGSIRGFILVAPIPGSTLVPGTYSQPGPLLTGTGRCISDGVELSCTPLPSTGEPVNGILVISPEPAGWTFMALGLSGLLLSLRRVGNSKARYGS